MGKPYKPWDPLYKKWCKGMETKVEEILESLYYDTCTKANDMKINEYMAVVEKDIEIRGVKLVMRKHFPVDKVTLYVSEDPRLSVLITENECYYVGD
jgi:hypothetical protein